MRTDSLFYEIFQTDPSIVFELINRPSPRNTTYSFTSVEVKETSFRMDGILVPPIYATNLPIVFVEVQGYKDKKGILYSSLFSQIFLYLHDYQPVNDWIAVLIFTKRNLDPGLPNQYQDFVNSQRFVRIYLDELNQAENLSLGLSLLKLIGMRAELAADSARELIARTRQELADVNAQRKFIELIETVFVYKFPELSRKEIEAMFGLNELKQTRVYQEAKAEGVEEGRQEGLEEGRQEGRQEGLEEGKLAAVPLLLKAGMKPEEIAEQLGIDLAAVQKVAQQQ